MRTYRFRFNKKSIVVTVDETAICRGQSGWFSEALQVADAVRASDIFTENDKVRIDTLTVYQIYKMLRLISQ
jgi:hypothetical protein